MVPGLPRFTGGAVGFWGYDVVRTIESLPDAPRDDRDLPDAIVMVADTLLVLDNLFNRATVIASVEVPAGASADELRRALRRRGGRGSSAGSSGSPRRARCVRLAIEAAPPLPAATSPYPDARFQEDVRESRNTSPRATPSRRC